MRNEEVYFYLLFLCGNYDTMAMDWQWMPVVARTLETQLAGAILRKFLEMRPILFPSIPSRIIINQYKN